MNIEFDKFVRLVGGPKPAMKVMGYSEGMISHVRSGKRMLSPIQAKKVVTIYPDLSFMRLLLPYEL